MLNSRSRIVNWLTHRKGNATARLPMTLQQTVRLKLSGHEPIHPKCNQRDPHDGMTHNIGPVHVTAAGRHEASTSSTHKMTIDCHTQNVSLHSVIRKRTTDLFAALSPFGPECLTDGCFRDIYILLICVPLRFQLRVTGCFHPVTPKVVFCSFACTHVTASCPCYSISCEHRPGIRASK